MRNRSLTTVLIAAYLAGQLAGMPHAHAADGTTHPDDHSRPHVHLPWLDHEHHGHGHGHEHHEHSQGQHPEPLSGQDRDHDSDAVYLPDGAGAPSVVASVVKTSDSCLTAILPLSMYACMPAAPSENPPDGLFPGEYRFGCPLYLAVRALRL